MALGLFVAGLLVYWFFLEASFYYPKATLGFWISLGCLVGGSVAGGFLGGAFGIASHRRMAATTPVLLGFGVACLGTAIVMSLRPGFSYEGTVVAWETPEGRKVQVGTVEVPDDSLGILGPIKVPKESMKVGVRVEQEIWDGTRDVYRRWNFITVTLLDEKKDYLLSFGGDVWNYAGREGEEEWEEEDDRYEATLEFPSPGKYYLRIRAESSSGLGASGMGPIHVGLYERTSWGTPAPLRWAAYLAFFFGAFCWVVPRVYRSGLIEQHLREGGMVQYDGQVWRVSGPLHCTYDDWEADEWTLQPTELGARTPRYLEHEYEADGSWETWLIAQPVELIMLRCEGPEGYEITVQRYVETHGEVPDTVMIEGQRYMLDDSGTVQREDTSIRYRNYAGSGGDFVTIEGTPGDSLDAVMGGKVSLSELSVVTDGGSE